MILVFVVMIFTGVDLDHTFAFLKILFQVVVMLNLRIKYYTLLVENIGGKLFLNKLLFPDQIFIYTLNSHSIYPNRSKIN